MLRFLFRRLVFLVFSAIGATLVVFLVSQLAGDPRQLFIPDTAYGITQDQWERVGAWMGFDKPLPLRYVDWLWHLVRGDMGFSYGQNRPVRELIASKMGATAKLALGAWLFAILVGVPMGMVAAVKRATIWDYLGRGFALFGQALPSFWVALIMILVFSVTLGWFPPGGRGEGLSIKHYVLPSIAVGWPASAALMRLTRSAMLDVLDSEYIKLARAKGVSRFQVVWKHALRNSLIPPVTSALFIFAGYLNGALVVETVFGWPGIGWLALNRAVYDNDFPLLQGTVFIFLLFYVVIAFVADIIYVVIDPRIRYR